MTFLKKRFIFEVEDGEVNVPLNFYKFSHFLMDYVEMFLLESDEDRLAYQSLVVTHNSFTIHNESQPEDIEYIRLKVIEAYVETLEDLFGFFVKFCDQMVATNVEQLESVKEKGQKDVPEIPWITKYFNDLVVGGSDRFTLALNAANFLAVNIYVNYGINYIFTKLITSRSPRSFCKDLNIPYSFGCSDVDDDYDERWGEIFRSYVTLNLNESDDEDDKILAKFEAERRQEVVDSGRIIMGSGDEDDTAAPILVHRGVSFGQRAGTFKNSFAPIFSKNDGNDDWSTEGSTSTQNVSRPAATVSGKRQTQRKQERNARRKVEAAASQPMHGGPTHNRTSIINCSYGRNRNLTDDGVNKSSSHRDTNWRATNKLAKDPQLINAVQLTSAVPQQLSNNTLVNAKIPQRLNNATSGYGKPSSYLCSWKLMNARPQPFDSTLRDSGAVQQPRCFSSDSTTNGFSGAHALINLRSAPPPVDLINFNNGCESSRRTNIRVPYLSPGARNTVATQHQQMQYAMTRKGPPRPCTVADDKGGWKKWIEGRMRAFADDDTE